MLLLTDNQPTVPNQQQEGHAHHQQHTDPSGTLRTLEDESGQRRGGKVEATTLKTGLQCIAQPDTDADAQEREEDRHHDRSSQADDIGEELFHH